MTANRLDRTAPIVPGESLGGISLRTYLIDIQDIIDSAYIALFPDKTWLRLPLPFEARYRLGPIEIAVDVRNGKIFKLIAYSGYTGKLLNGIAVGMTVKEAQSIDPRIHYSEAEELLHVKDVPGVTLDVSEEDPPPATVPSLEIIAISVILPELMVPDGVDAVLDGRW